jgi:hypothetical protein
VPKIAYALIPLCLFASTGLRAQSLTLNRVRSLAAELGYKPTSTKDVVTLDGLGAHGSDIKITVAKNNSTMTIYTSWDIPPDKQKSIPAIDMLKANSSSQFAFGVYGKEGDLSVDLVDRI